MLGLAHAIICLLTLRLESMNANRAKEKVLINFLRANISNLYGINPGSFSQ
jgi:hypothetical protein